MHSPWSLLNFYRWKTFINVMKQVYVFTRYLCRTEEWLTALLNLSAVNQVRQSTHTSAGHNVTILRSSVISNEPLFTCLVYAKWSYNNYPHNYSKKESFFERDITWLRNFFSILGLSQDNLWQTVLSRTIYFTLIVWVALSICSLPFNYTGWTCITLEVVLSQSQNACSQIFIGIE